jgi:hypothetical protein
MDRIRSGALHLALRGSGPSLAAPAPGGHRAPLGTISVATGRRVRRDPRRRCLVQLLGAAAEIPSPPRSLSRRDRPDGMTNRQ